MCFNLFKLMVVVVDALNQTSEDCSSSYPNTLEVSCSLLLGHFTFHLALMWIRESRSSLIPPRPPNPL